MTWPSVVVGVTIYTATLEKEREYGVMKALGTPNKHLLAVVAQQTTVCCLLGFLVGAAGTLSPATLAVLGAGFCGAFTTYSAFGYETVRLADRVWVMTPRPGRIAAAIEIPLPRPRRAGTASDPTVAAMEAQVRDALASVHAPELTGWAEPNGEVAA